MDIFTKFLMFVGAATLICIVGWLLLRFVPPLSKRLDLIFAKASAAQWLTALGLVLAIMSFTLAAVTLQQDTQWKQKQSDEEQKWRRRQAAAEMLKDWNDQTRAHREAVLAAYPQLYNMEEYTPLTRQLAEDLWRIAKDEDPEQLKLRGHVIEIMNHLEFIATAYLEDIADRTILEKSYRGFVLRWYRFFERFIEIASEDLGYSAWEPVTDLVMYWREHRTARTQ